MRRVYIYSEQIGVLLVATVTDIQSVRSQACVYIYTYRAQYGDGGQAKEI